MGTIKYKKQQKYEMQWMKIAYLKLQLCIKRAYHVGQVRIKFSSSESDCMIYVKSILWRKFLCKTLYQCGSLLKFGL